MLFTASRNLTPAAASIPENVFLVYWLTANVTQCLHIEHITTELNYYDHDPSSKCLQHLLLELYADNEEFVLHHNGLSPQ